MSAERRERLITWLESQTESLRRQVEGEDDPLQKVVSNFGCQSRNVAKLVSILTDKPVSIAGEIDIPMGAVSIVLRRRNSHNYGIGKPVMAVGRGYNNALTHDADGNAFIGNQIPVLFKTTPGGTAPTLRLATREEIVKMVDKIGPEIERKLVLI